MVAWRDGQGRPTLARSTAAASGSQSLPALVPAQRFSPTGSSMRAASLASGSPSHGSQSQPRFGYGALDGIGKPGMTQTLPRINQGLKMGVTFRDNTSQAILEANADKLPAIWSPKSHREGRRLSQREEAIHASHQKMDPRRQDPRQLARKKQVNRQLSLMQQSDSKGFQLGSKDSRNKQAAALLGDRRFVQTLQEELRERPEQREAREKLLNDHRWAMVFAPVPPRPELLPKMFGGKLPSVKALDHEQWCEDVPRGSRTGSFGGTTVGKFGLGRRVARNFFDADDAGLMELTFEEAERLIKVCRRLAETVPQSLEARYQVLDRGSYCRLVCAFSGFSHFEGEKANLLRAVGHFDQHAETVPIRGADDSVEGHVHGLLLPPAGRSAPGSPATMVPLHTPALLDLPIYYLFRQLFTDMVKDIMKVAGPNAEMKAAEDQCRLRFFEKLTAEAEEYVTERVALVQRRMNPELEKPKADNNSSADDQESVHTLKISARSMSPTRDYSAVTSPRSGRRSSMAQSPVDSPRSVTNDSSKRGLKRGASSKELSGRRGASSSKDATGSGAPGSKEATERKDAEAPPSMQATGPAVPAALAPQYAAPNYVLQGEALSSHFFEPEVMHFMAEFKEVFHMLFATYRDVPTDPTGEGERRHGHMTLNAFLRFCGDFGLFPQYANFQTVQWLYYTAEGYVHNPPKLKIPEVPVGATRSNRSEGARRRPSVGGGDSQGAKRRPSVAGDVNKVRSRRPRKTVVETGPKILYCGKWLGPHLQWMTKEPEDATEMERWAASLLGAIDDWLDDARLTVTELFQFVDIDNNGVIDKDEFELGVDFMDLHSRPTPPQLEAAFGLLVAPGEAVIEILSLEMAIRCSAKRQENLNRAGNIFTKEPLKMTQEEFNACIFFREVSRLLGWKQKTPGELFDEFGKKKKGKLDSVSLTQQVHQMIQGMDRGSPVLGIGVCNPFDILDLNGDGLVTKDEFCSVIEKVEESKRLRELNGIEEKHPIFLSARVKPPERSCQWIFGRGAFVECLMKIAFQHLGFHGTSEQKLQPCLSKAIWLLLLLHWQFDTAKGHKSNEKPQDSKAAEVESGAEWDLPKYVTPLRRLLWTHPRLFLDHPAPSGEPQKQSIWDDIGAKADPIVHALLQNGPPQAQGLDSLDRGVLSAAAEA